jgi:hypothetical protein
MVRSEESIFHYHQRIAISTHRCFGVVFVSTGLFRGLNNFIARNIRTIEMIGVLMRIFSFSLVSWMGPESPFLFVWAFNTVDAIILTWCALIKKDLPYSILNVFWIGVGVVGMMRAVSPAMGH